jgi:hypothetical protein
VVALCAMLGLEFSIMRVSWTDGRTEEEEEEECAIALIDSKNLLIMYAS